jgi:beta-N-acetylhexosaminidase
MKKWTILSFSCFALLSCAQEQMPIEQNEIEKVADEEQLLSFEFSLSDFFSDNSALDFAVNHVFSHLDDTLKIAQLLMPAMGEHGQPKQVIDDLVSNRLIGGVLMLNGTKEEFSSWITEYNRKNVDLDVPPFLYSADAEPSLVNRKIKGSTPVAKANMLKTAEEVRIVANNITADLKEIGINYNFAPVVDMAPNKTVGWRSFGHFPDSVINWSSEFILATQSNGVIATAKHFPGHGYVVGDTHKKLVYIDGELREVENYPALIAEGLLSIMIAHIAIKNNQVFETNDLPSTVSKNIVTGLLRDSLGFEGLIVTDALNMGGVTFVEDAPLKTIQAGCDIALMPVDARKAHASILENYTKDAEFAGQVDDSVRRILRAKICLGLYSKKD